MEPVLRTIHPAELEKKAKEYAEGLCKSLQDLNAVHWKRLEKQGLEPLKPLLPPERVREAFFWSMADTLADRFTVPVDEE